ncbi:MAG: HD-GYP domain-containing protein [Actinomycetota bacterium]
MTAKQLTAVDLRVVDERTENLAGVVESLAYAVEIKDPHTGQHMFRTAMLASACLEQIDYELSLDEDVGYGFLLHDVGKIGVPDHILRKPGELTGDEWSIMKTHPEMGARIVRPMGFAQSTIDVIAYHHERWDGRGYPYGLEGTEIPLAARVFSVVDTYDALTCERPYRQALPKDVALHHISLGAGTQFDPVVVASFISTII